MRDGFVALAKSFDKCLMLQFNFKFHAQTSLLVSTEERSQFTQGKQ